MLAEQTSILAANMICRASVMHFNVVVEFVNLTAQDIKWSKNVTPSLF